MVVAHAAPITASRGRVDYVLLVWAISLSQRDEIFLLSTRVPSARAWVMIEMVALGFPAAQRTSDARRTAKPKQKNSAEWSGKVNGGRVQSGLFGYIHELPAGHTTNS